MKIGLVTVTFNSSSVLDDFFVSIKNQDYNNFKLYIVDNASSDDTIDKVEKWDCHPKILLKNNKNIGVSSANNQGINLALNDNCDFILLINNDTIFEDKLISKLIDAHIKYGSSIVVPKIKYYLKSNVIWYAGGFYNKTKACLNYHRGQDEIDCGQYNFNDIVEYAPTCCALIHKTVFEDVGLMDEKFFVYFDDADFFYRVLRFNRHHIKYIYDIHFLHKIGSLTKSRVEKTNIYSDFFIIQSCKNHVYFLRKQKAFLAYINLIYLWFYLTLRFFISNRFEKKWRVFMLIQTSYFNGFKI